MPIIDIRDPRPIVNNRVISGNFSGIKISGFGPFFEVYINNYVIFIY